MKLLYYVRQLSLRNKEMGKQAFIWERYVVQYISVLDYRPQLNPWLNCHFHHIGGNTG